MPTGARHPAQLALGIMRVRFAHARETPCFTSLRVVVIVWAKSDFVPVEGTADRVAEEHALEGAASEGGKHCREEAESDDPPEAGGGKRQIDGRGRSYCLRSAPENERRAQNRMQCGGY